MSELKANGSGTSLITELSCVFQDLPGMVPGIQKLIIAYIRFQVSEGNFQLQLANFPCSMVSLNQFLFACFCDDKSISAFNIEQDFKLVRSIIVEGSTNRFYGVIAVTVCQGFVLAADRGRSCILMFDAHKPLTEWAFTNVNLREELGTITDMAATDGIICVANDLGILLFNVAVASDRSSFVLSVERKIIAQGLYSCGIFAHSKITVFVINRSCDICCTLQKINTNNNQSHFITLNDIVIMDTISVCCGRLYVRDINSHLSVFDAESGESLETHITLPTKARRVTVIYDGDHRWLFYCIMRDNSPFIYSQRLQDC